MILAYFPLLFVIILSYDCSISSKFLTKEKYHWLISEVPVPQYAVDWGKNIREDFLEKPKKENIFSRCAHDLILNFYYDKNGDACMSATVSANLGCFYKKTWKPISWSGGSGTIGFGENQTRWNITKRNSDEAEIRMEKRRKDEAFCEVEKVVKKIAEEYEYDFKGAYGVEAKYRTPEVKKASCGEYADVVSNSFKGHPFVDHVEKHIYGNHAWNTVFLKDGRKVYVDSTWYTGNYIDKEGYAVHVMERSAVAVTFDADEFNCKGGAIDAVTGELLRVHFATNPSVVVNWPRVGKGLVEKSGREMGEETKDEDRTESTRREVATQIVKKYWKKMKGWMEL